MKALTRDPLMILVVDDQAESRTILSRVLSRNGYQVSTAVRGDHAISVAGTVRPALILLDMFLPDMDGIETCRRLRSIAELASVPIIFVTAAHDRGLLLRAYECGAVDYVTKPFVIGELLARVRTHLELKQARDRLAAMSQERDEITNILIHDLKNPLTNVLFANDWLRRKLDDPAHSHELINESDAAVREALRTIGQFLARRRAAIDAADDGALEQLQLSAVVEPLLTELAERARRKELRLSPSGDVTVKTDRSRISEVFRLLIEHAIKVSHPGCEIAVRLALTSAGTARCAVLDCGPGLTPAEERRLFRRYARFAPNAGNSTLAGFELVAARERVAQLGGHLWFEPNHYNGTTYIFDLPCAPERGADINRTRNP